MKRSLPLLVAVFYASGGEVDVTGFTTSASSRNLAISLSKNQRDSSCSSGSGTCGSLPFLLVNEPRTSFVTRLSSSSASSRGEDEVEEESDAEFLYLLESTQNTDFDGDSGSSSSWEESETFEDDTKDDIDDSLKDETETASGGTHDDDDHDDDTNVRLYEECIQWKQAIDKTLLALQKKKKSLLTELGKAEKLEETVARAQLLTSNLYLFTKGVTSAIVIDWEATNDNVTDDASAGVEVELRLDPQYESASAEANALFEQARKLKRGSKVVGQLLEDTDAAIQTLHEIMTDFQSATTTTTTTAAITEIDENILRFVQDRLLRTSRSTSFEPPPQQQSTSSPTTLKKRGPGIGTPASSTRRQTPVLGTPASNIRKITAPNTGNGGGCTILVGRNRRGNEYLTMSVARPNDFWFHARGCPGAHVVLQQQKRKQQTKQEEQKNGEKEEEEGEEECIQLAANLAVFYSDLRLERRAPVTMTQAKHITKPRNAPLGAVNLRKELRVLTGIPSNAVDVVHDGDDDDDVDDNNIQPEYYRATDRAKNRKQTQAADEDRRRKRRQQAKTKSKRQKRQDPREKE